MRTTDTLHVTLLAAFFVCAVLFFSGCRSAGLRRKDRNPGGFAYPVIVQFEGGPVIFCDDDGKPT